MKLLSKIWQVFSSNSSSLTTEGHATDGQSEQSTNGHHSNASRAAEPQQEEAVTKSTDIKGWAENIDEIKHSATECPSNPSVFIFKQQVTLCRVIGSGQFGDVFEGQYRNEPVAVKVSSCSEFYATNAEQRDAARKLVNEAEAMRQLNHPHIIKLIGVCRAEPVWLVLEFAPLGQLRTYLRMQKHNLKRSQLFSYCYQISEAIGYLLERNILHRDIAARNVLVVEANLVKLADFGLSRFLLEDNDVYYKTGKGKLPVKWLAPESIFYRRFTHASDIWMFAVCTWEIFSWGEKPFAQVPNLDVVSLLERGERLPKPGAAPLRLYNLWLLCWSFDADRRPDIKKVSDTLKNIMLDECSNNDAVPTDKLINFPTSHHNNVMPVHCSATLQSLPSTGSKKLDANRSITDDFRRQTLTIEQIKSIEQQRKFMQELAKKIRAQLFDQTLLEQKLQSEKDDEWLDEQQRRFVDVNDTSSSFKKTATQAKATDDPVVSQITELSRRIIRLTNDICFIVSVEETTTFSSSSENNNNNTDDAEESLPNLNRELQSAVNLLTTELDILILKEKNIDHETKDFRTQLSSVRQNLLSSMQLFSAAMAANIENSEVDDADFLRNDDTHYCTDAADQIATAGRLVANDVRILLHYVVT